jgi:hypothetical protein
MGKKMKFINLIILSFALASNAQAGFNGFTMHSRANCVNNESISWDATTYRVLGTVTQHFRNGEWIHGVSTGWQNTWRSAAVHWSEAAPGSGWRVHGYHWFKDGSREVLLAETDVPDCSIYDGWWDKK